MLRHTGMRTPAHASMTPLSLQSGGHATCCPPNTPRNRVRTSCADSSGTPLVLRRAPPPARVRCPRARCDSGMRDAGDAELRVPEHFSEARACAGRLHAWRACVAQVAQLRVCLRLRACALAREAGGCLDCAASMRARRCCWSCCGRGQGDACCMQKEALCLALSPMQSCQQVRAMRRQLHGAESTLRRRGQGPL